MDDSDIDCFVEDGFMEDLEDLEDIAVSLKPPENRRNSQKQYKVLSIDDIVAEIMAYVFQVQELIPVSGNIS